MTGRDILIALNDIDDELIEQADRQRGAGRGKGGPRSVEISAAGAENVRPIGGKSGWRRYSGAVIGVAAACILLMAALPVIRNSRVTKSGDASGAAVGAMGETADSAAAVESDGKVFLGQAATAYVDMGADDADEETFFDMEDAAEDTAAFDMEDDAGEAMAAAAAEDTAAAEEEAVLDDAEASEEELALIANPFTEYESLEAAEAAVGFTLSAPSAFNGAEMTIVRGMGSELIEVIYTDAEGEEQFRLRKGVGTDDISGDYNDYSTSESLAVGESVVEIKGNAAGSVSLATWVCDDCSYALEAQEHPMTTEDFKEFKAMMAGE